MSCDGDSGNLRPTFRFYGQTFVPPLVFAIVLNLVLTLGHVPSSIAANPAPSVLETSGWSCGTLPELQARLNALQTACSAPAQKKTCRAGSGVGSSVALTIKDCIKGGMPELNCARIVACESGMKVCKSGGFYADSSVEAVALCVKGSAGAGDEICQQTASCN